MAARRALLVLGILVPIAAYLWFIAHYAVNVPTADDWFMVSVVNSAIHGHLTIHELWVQYGDTRILGSRLFLASIAPLVHLNERSVVFFSAAVFIATYALLLLIFRAYLKRPLTFLPVLTIGVVWFSWADVQNALWSFQIAWYLSLFFFAAMVFLLLIPRTSRNLCFALGVLAGVGASLTIVQGFILWPVGLICLLWATPWGRRTYWESAIWLLAAAGTLAIYLPGYSSFTTQVGCGVDRRAACHVGGAFGHPVQAVIYVITTVGNVVPTWSQELYDGRSPHQALDLGAHELLGSVICVVAIAVVVQSWRERHRQPVPLALVLVVFALLFDVMIALGRLTEGLPSSVENDRFTMPNLVLLVGILVFAWAHAPSRERRARAVGFVALLAFVAVQCVLSTGYGVRTAALRQQGNEIEARIVVNLNEIPISRRACDVDMAVWSGNFVSNPSRGLQLVTTARAMAVRDHLTVFGSRLERDRYRDKGVPTIPGC